ncbi:tyrosine-type recombinase/integrase, partial [Megamonas funiformis]|uniref:tyrosine-type recombinase/integrase n=1 Tax=Megamonas funiformis TaxID=437897 RepID=UPI00242C1F37
IFTTFYGAISHPDSMNVWLRKFVKKNNLPHISPHSLRHMTATYLINAGVDLVTVAGVMGHANSTTTQVVYAHFLQKSQNKTVKIMDSILNESISSVSF